ncbi:MAG: DUF4331 family protein [Pyrinomonadaceae bacterium]
MIRPKNKRISLAALALTAALVFQLTPPARINASDHIDSPTIAQDRGSDIADTYAFLDPNDNSKVVMMMSTQGFIVSGEHFGMVIFDPNIRYRFEIENTGDARPDKFVDVTYSRGLGRLTAQTATVTLSDATGNGRGNNSGNSNKGQTQTLLVGPTTIATQEPQPIPPPPPVITTRADVSFFAGNADDPFFLDDTGANRLVASSIMNPGSPDKSLLGFRQGRDTYAGFNTLITAVSIPAALLRGNANVIGINAVTQRQRIQMIRDGSVTGQGPYENVDRDGNPLVNNGLISAPIKDAYNGATTEDDAAGRFEADIVRNLRNFGTDTAHINMILDQIVRRGDILRLDLRVPNAGSGGGDNPDGGFGHMGGRRLKDDVVDMTFTLINNGQLLTDFVNGNEVPFRNQFPFVADPTQPFPPGQDPDDHTRQ